MNPPLLGIHHVTAICGDPQANFDFYAGVLGLRLVKRTVNFDDPQSYHLYYGDYSGQPGTIMTFFAWPGAHRGRRGTGAVDATAFAVPREAIGFWKMRLEEHRVAVEEMPGRFGDEIIGFDDPDGMRLEIVASADSGEVGQSEVPAEFAIRSFHSVSAAEEGYERTAKLLTDVLGFRLTQQERNRFRYEIGDVGAGRRIDLLCMPDAPRAHIAGGNVHHIAWRTADDEAQLAWRSKIAALGYNVSPVMDRDYFQSIYFREPGGVLFEIATDPPGFTIDEPLAELGTHLKLPVWMESARLRIEKLLPPLNIKRKAAR